MQGNGTDFLKTVLDAYNNRSGKVDARGKCGYELGSSEYLHHLEKQVFLQELPSYHSGEDYARILREALESIAKQLERDLSTAAQENSYITDPTAIVLRSAARVSARARGTRPTTSITKTWRTVRISFGRSTPKTASVLGCRIRKMPNEH